MLMRESLLHIQGLKNFTNAGAISKQQAFNILTDISQLPGLDEGLNNLMYFSTSLSLVRWNENCFSGHLRILSPFNLRKISET